MWISQSVLTERTHIFHGDVVFGGGGHNGSVSSLLETSYIRPCVFAKRKVLNLAGALERGGGWLVFAHTNVLLKPWAACQAESISYAVPLTGDATATYPEMGHAVVLTDVSETHVAAKAAAESVEKRTKRDCIAVLVVVVVVVVYPRPAVGRILLDRSPVSLRHVV